MFTIMKSLQKAQFAIIQVIRMNIENAKNKQTAAGISMVSNSVLIAVKLIAGFVSGSISIISEAIHSFSDLLASFIAFVSVKKSSQPADKDHSYGHGKYEDLSGLIEGGLIILASLYISYEAVKKIIAPHEISISIDLGIYVMAFSAIVNVFVSAYLFHIAKKTQSLAIFADAEHLRTDVISSAGVCLGLVLIKITKLQILDPIIALVVAVIIFIAGAKICNETKNNLVDKSLSEEDISKIENVIKEFLGGNKLISLKHLRTRHSGIKKNIELTIIANKDMSLFEGHNFCNKIEKRLEEVLGNTDVTIHLEPDV